MIFSIILPTKNNERTIGRCLDSIVSQNFKDLEVIFVDNFSRDSTMEIAQSYKDKIDIKIFQIGPERHKQRRYGYEKSIGKYVYFIDSDMYMKSSDLVAEATEKLEKSPHLGALIVPEDNYSGVGYWTRVKAFERSFYDGDDNIEAARIFRREAYAHVGGYNDSLIAGEDWDLSERIREIYSVDRIGSRILHDEGEIHLWGLLKKKYYYGSKIQGYLSSPKKKKSSPWTKIYFLRPVYYKKFYKFLEEPLLVPGFLILMSAELVAFGFGYAHSKISLHG